ncbi:MAG: pilus assembly protein TadG-related protein [Alteraurantiacibacter sp.]
MIALSSSSLIRRAATVLARLARESSGNVIIIVAASLFPLLALVGSGIDMGRGYLAETRLQQACDAGTLAARKRMGTAAAVTGTIPASVADVGQRFFNLNFRDGAYGSENRQFTMELHDDYSISGEASADIETTIMGAFGYETIPVSVGCQVQLNMGNLDIMMVLDTTGSMATINPGDSKTRIQALRDTVLSFYTQMEANKTPGSRIRYGFVPYSTNVNVGRLLQDDWLVDEWHYNYRQRQNATNWKYADLDLDLAFLETGDTTNVPMGGTPAAPTDVAVQYRGCIEERDTYEINDYDNVNLNRALDLDIDRVPDPTDEDTQWRPMINELSYVREVRTNGSGMFTPGSVNSPDEFINAWWWGYGACPAASQRLQEMTSAQVSTYTAGLTPQGSTYHDIGMIWGGRLLSPTGLFADDNADVGAAPTTRHLIFLTDGETAPLDISYGSYGIEQLDRRRWRPTSALTLTQTVEARFSFACEEVKKRNIQVWVISFGTGANSIMQNCAGAERYFVAANSAALQQTFTDIARRMTDLRMVD